MISGTINTTAPPAATIAAEIRLRGLSTSAATATPARLRWTLSIVID